VFSLYCKVIFISELLPKIKKILYKKLIRYGNSSYTAYSSVVETCEVFMTWLASWNCNFIVQVDVVILNTPVEKS